jgi:hypothetical protein
MAKAINWPKGQLVDEVLDRDGAYLASRPSHVDSASRAMQPAHHQSHSIARPGFGIVG